MAGVSVNPKEVERLLGRLPREVDLRLHAAARDMGSRFINKMDHRVREGGGAGLHVRTNKLRGSFGHTVTASKAPGGGAQFELRMFSAGAPYARIHEHGGTIRPTGGRQYLTVPMPANLTPGGAVRNPSAAALRDDPSRDTFVLKRPKGAFIVERKGDKLVFLWKLVPKVVIPPRLGWRDTFDSQADQQREILDRAMTAALQAADR